MYAIVITYSFDGDTPIYCFSTYEEAIEKLRGFYEEELRICTEENGWEAYGSISDDGRYAKITVRWDDCDEVTEYRVGTVYLY